MRLRSGSQSLAAAILALLTILLAMGCSDLPDTDKTAGGDTVTTGVVTTLPGGTTTSGVDVSATTLAPVTTLAPATTSPSAATTTTEALSSAEQVLPGGHIKGLGYITDVWMDASGRHLKIDYVEIIGGEAEATAAAIEDGAILPGETWEGEFYINNDNPLLRTFSVSASVEIYTAIQGLPRRSGRSAVQLGRLPQLLDRDRPRSSTGRRPPSPDLTMVDRARWQYRCLDDADVHPVDRRSFGDRPGRSAPSSADPTGRTS